MSGSANNAVQLERDAAAPIMGSSTLEVQEHGTVELPQNLLDENGTVLIDPASLKFCEVFFSHSDRKMMIRARNVIGHLPLNDQFELVIKSKLNISNIEWMIGRSQGIKNPSEAVSHHMRSYGATADKVDFLFNAMADRFFDALDDITKQGRWKIYQTKHATSAKPHGRIDRKQTVLLSERKGRPNAAFSYFERTMDTPANRIIVAALAVLEQLYKDKPESVGRRVTSQNHLRDFRNVKHDPNYKYRSGSAYELVKSIPQNSDAYIPALMTADIILQGLSPKFESEGPLQIKSLLLDVANIFERYALSFMTERLLPKGIHVLSGEKRAPHGAKEKLYDPFVSDGKNGDASPDFVFRDNGSVSLVMDAKYAISEGTPDRKHVEQVVLYANRYGCEKAMLLYPSRGKDQKSIISIGKIGKIEVLRGGIEIGNSKMSDEETDFIDQLLPHVEKP